MKYALCCLPCFIRHNRLMSTVKDQLILYRDTHLLASVFRLTGLEIYSTPHVLATTD